MKLRNKKTGEIGLVHCDATMFSNKIGVFIDNNHIDLSNPYKIYTSLAELNEEWEDYKELQMFYWIDYDGKICKAEAGTMDRTKIKQIGNYFETKEEAEKAVEKLKAWKRLKDKGFKFESWWGGSKDISFWVDTEIDGDTAKDLDLLFGGEE